MWICYRYSISPVLYLGLLLDCDKANWSSAQPNVFLLPVAKHKVCYDVEDVKKPLTLSRLPTSVPHIK